MTGSVPEAELPELPRIQTLQELRKHYRQLATPKRVSLDDRQRKLLEEFLLRKDLPGLERYFRRNAAKVGRSNALSNLREQLEQLVLLVQVPLDGLDSGLDHRVGGIPEGKHAKLTIDSAANEDKSLFSLADNPTLIRELSGMGPAQFLIQQWQHNAERIRKQQPQLVEVNDLGMAGLAGLRAACDAQLPTVFAGTIKRIEGTDYWSVLARKLQHIILQEAAEVRLNSRTQAELAVELGVAVERIKLDTSGQLVDLEPLSFAKKRAASILKGPTYRKHPQDLEVANHYCNDSQIEIPPHASTKISIPPHFGEDPFADNNWRFSFHSLRWSDRLRRSYVKTKEETFRDTHLRVIKRWIRSYGDPANPEAPNQAWSDMGTGIRSRGIAVALYSYGYDAELVAALKTHLEWLLDENNWPARGNHLLHVYRGIYDTAAVLGDTRAEDKALELIYEYLRAEITEEGEDTEGSLMYQLANRQWSKEIVNELETDGQEVPEDIKERVRRMVNIGFYATDAGGNMAQYGDSNHVVRKPVTVGSKLPAPYGDHRTVKPLYIYPKAGIACVRSKNTNLEESTFAMLRVHPPGPKQTHGHDDHGQVLLSFGKYQVLRDSGRFDYSRDPRSLYLKSAAAHSVARSSDPKKRPLDCVRGEFGPVTEGETFRAVRAISQYAEDITWYRTLVVHDSGEVDIYDYWDAPEGETFELLWQVDQLHLSRDSNGSWRLATGTHKVATLTVSLPDREVDVLRAQKIPLAGWRADAYASLVASNTFVVAGLPANTLIRTSFKRLHHTETP
ncbi:heparinase II/III family protein [Micrococcoides hystricis]|uniref:Heparinase II/III family protein n=1 Tax=Micrococcoides hystricis TaxID=1572761 RepID=A0ABV6PDD0_9MICC